MSFGFLKFMEKRDRHGFNKSMRSLNMRLNTRISSEISRFDIMWYKNIFVFSITSLQILINSYLPFENSHLYAFNSYLKEFKKSTHSLRV